MRNVLNLLYMFLKSPDLNEQEDTAFFLLCYVTMVAKPRLF